ncbi:MAG: uridylate kinase [Gammaproteobacteria bacterium]
MWVLKLGGSLAGTRELRCWLRALAEHGGGQMVVVPGGGPFADRVRDTQRHWGYDDETAHHMALLAMAQYGLALAGMEPRLRAAHGLDEIGQAWLARQVAVWIPAWPEIRDIALPASWDYTSDSVAAWLARRLGSGRLLLVKSPAPTGRSAGLHQLMRQGILDSGFERSIEGQDLSVWWLGGDQHADLEGLLNAGGTAAACRIQPPEYGPASQFPR